MSLHYDAFVSYSNADGEALRPLVDWLRSQNLRVFVSDDALLAGRPWMPELERVIFQAGSAVVLIGPKGLGNTQQYEVQLALFRQSKSPEFPVIPVLLPGCTEPPAGFLRLQTWIDLSGASTPTQLPSALAALHAAIRGQEIESAPIRHTICPYMGLQPFKEENAAFFCGRETLTQDLVSKVEQFGFVTVVGRSGSGKSSLVSAGLMPALRQSWAGNVWDLVSLRPRRSPLRTLAACFLPPNLGLAERDTYLQKEETALRSGDSNILARMVEDHCDMAPGRPDRLVIHVDEWEGLYYNPNAESLADPAVLRARSEDVDRFVALLLGAAEAGRTKVIVAVRADSYEPLVRHPRISRLLPRQQVNVGPMSRDELRRAIVTPAKLVGLGFEPPQLVEEILDDAGVDEGMLPLLQYALKETWQRRNATAMTADGYVGAGRVRSAMNETAERIFAALTAAQQHAARKLFLGLVNPGEGRQDTRSRSWMPQDDLQQSIVRKFAAQDARLLVTGAEIASVSELPDVGEAPDGIPSNPEIKVRATVEIAHDALISVWPRLSQWVDGSRDYLRARLAIRQQRDEWERSGRNDELLLQPGLQVERGRNLLHEPADVAVEELREYIELSAERARRQQEDRDRNAAIFRASEVERATGELFRLDEIMDSMCREILGQFDFVTVQLTDKESRTIRTVFGLGLSDDWYGIGKHSYHGDPELWDIQAWIVAHWPPSIEILSGRDRRFDQFIFRRDGHSKYVRVFAPIILSSNQHALEQSQWARKPNCRALTDSPTDMDRRVVLEPDAKYTALARSDPNFEVIGTIEAGFRNPDRFITDAQAEEVLRIASRHAGRLRRASLDYVFETIAVNAMQSINADSASLHFFLDQRTGRYIHEAWAGDRYQGKVYPRSDGLGQRALATRRHRYSPDSRRGEDQDYLQQSFPEAYELGIRAQAVFPIFLGTEHRGPYSSTPDAAEQLSSRSGLLYVRFNKPHEFSISELEWLNFFANRAANAIRQATYFGALHEGARRLVNLHHVAQSFADNSSAADLLEDIAGNACNIFAADLVTVYEYRSAEGIVDRRPGAAGMFVSLYRATGTVPDPMSAPYKLLAHNKHVYASDVRACDVLSPTASPGREPGFIEREKIISCAGVILKAAKEVHGLMFVNFRRHHTFTREERSLVETLAATAAVAIRNRKLLVGN